MGHRSRLRLHSVEGIPNGGVSVGKSKKGGGGLNRWAAVCFQLVAFFPPPVARRSDSLHFSMSTFEGDSENIMSFRQRNSLPVFPCLAASQHFIARKTFRGCLRSCCGGQSTLYWACQVERRCQPSVSSYSTVVPVLFSDVSVCVSCPIPKAVAETQMLSRSRSSPRDGCDMVHAVTPARGSFDVLMRTEPVDVQVCRPRLSSRGDVKVSAMSKVTLGSTEST